MENEREFLTLKEAADDLGIPAYMMFELLYRLKVPHTGRWADIQIPKKQFKTWVKNNQGRITDYEEGQLDDEESVTVYSVERVAEILGLSEQGVCVAMVRGGLPYCQAFMQFFIPQESFHMWLVCQDEFADLMKQLDEKSDGERAEEQNEDQAEAAEQSAA